MDIELSTGLREISQCLLKAPTGSGVNAQLSFYEDFMLHRHLNMVSK